MPIAVASLRWQDVDPGAHVFDEASVAAAVERLGCPELRSSSARREFEDAVSRALLSEFGAWIAGWNWAASEPGCGGPVRAYCCAEHSLKGSAAAAGEVVVGAVRDWHARLRELAAIFATLRTESQELTVDEAACRGATRLLPVVLEWTGAEDAWYSTFERILAWYLEFLLGDSERILPAVRGAIGGRFESWLTPDADTAERVCRDIADAVARECAEGAPYVDALSAWILKRQSVRWATERLYSPGPVRVDGHERFIERVDRLRGAERATRMLHALGAAREAARSQRPLDLELMTEWQSTVLGEDVSFRDRPAVAHGGAELYGLDAKTQRRFEQCLSEAQGQGMDASLPGVVRAARVYLDVCYFHPFPDGNARAARLALDYVLTAEGLALHAAEPVFLVARRVGDDYGVYAFQHIVDFLAGPRES